MAAVHAWFSIETALRHGSSVYLKPDGSTVNVTRVDADKDVKGHHPHDEKYVGQVVSSEDGGCVRGIERVKGITA